MPVATYTKTGTKATTPAKLDKSVFSVETKSHDLLKTAYNAYLANSRANLARVKTRGEVVGSTRKPHRQKGTGRARAGSRYNPIWRGGGITFGPTGNENYSKQLNVKAKRQAVRQALSLVNTAGKIKIVEAFPALDGKTKDFAKFLNKVEAKGTVLCIVETNNSSKQRATTNIPNLKVSGASYLSVFDILNADSLVFTKDALSKTTGWLGEHK
jgi:large subunit ribosomal protein L4